MTISFTGIRDSRSALRTEIPSGHSFSATSTLPCGCGSLLESQLTLALVAGILRAVVRMYVRQMLVMHQALLTFLLSEFSEIDVFLIHNSAVGLVRNSFLPDFVTRNPYARRETKCHTGDAFSNGGRRVRKTPCSSCVSLSCMSSALGSWNGCNWYQHYRVLHSDYNSRLQ